MYLASFSFFPFVRHCVCCVCRSSSSLGVGGGGDEEISEGKFVSHGHVKYSRLSNCHFSVCLRPPLCPLSFVLFAQVNGSLDCPGV
ncbi:hypothetical protein IWZ00DRAFT_497291 [Phyllosticta capitalensis]